MQEYRIMITETSSRIVTVSAEDEICALVDVRQQYADEDIVLDATDYDDVEFEVV